LTPIGKIQNLFVKEISNNKITLSDEINIHCYFFIVGERIDIEKLKVEI
jgi:hypothetical protein